MALAHAPALADTGRLLAAAAAAQSGGLMPGKTSQGNRGPVTLVVTREDAEGGVLSWTFGSEDAAMSVIRAFRQDERWLLMRGVHESGALALKAAHRSPRIIIKENRPSGLMRRCEATASATDDDKHRTSA